MLTFLHPSFSYLHGTIPSTHIVRFEQFSDGWPRIFLENTASMYEQNITYISNFRSVESIFEQIAWLDGVLRYGARSLHVHIPFFPAASMERDTPSGELSVANVFTRMLGLIGERKSGHVHIHLYDSHDEREIFYFPPNVQIVHHTTTSIFRKDILSEKHPIILFPDAGAKKAFSRFFSDSEIVTCAKVRHGPSAIEMYFEGGDLREREVYIIDDHIRSGSTLIEASRYAREK